MKECIPNLAGTEERLEKQHEVALIDSLPLTLWQTRE